MKGLILKDILNLKKSFKMIGAMAILYTGISFAAGEMSFLIGMIIILATTLSIGSMSYDDLAKWDVYALAMPIDRKTIVKEKYILGIGFCILGSIIAAAIWFIGAIFINDIVMNEMFITLYVTSMIALLMVAVCFPLMFKFGTEKGRTFLFMIIGVPVILFVALSKMGVPMPSEAFLMGLLGASPFLVAFIMIISLIISIKIYNKKEF